jgi:ribosomal-protein-alanine N-acetyltransferase
MADASFIVALIIQARRVVMWPRRRKGRNGEDQTTTMAIATGPVLTAMSEADLNECWRLDQRCFSDGEAYDRETIRYLLSHSQSVCYKLETASRTMIGFVVGMLEPDGTGHVVALGIDPEHRRRGNARRLMVAVEDGFRTRRITAVRLEVRTTNEAAQLLYTELGYKTVRRMPHYYTSGDDGYLMVKTLD